MRVNVMRKVAFVLVVSATLPSLSPQSKKSVEFRVVNRIVLEPKKGELMQVVAVPSGGYVGRWRDPDDHYRPSIERYDAAGKRKLSIGSFGSGPGHYSILMDMALDDKSVLWAGDNGQKRISRFSLDGQVLDSILVQNPGFAAHAILFFPAMNRYYLAGCLPHLGLILNGCTLVHEYSYDTHRHLRSFLETDSEWKANNYYRFLNLSFDSE